MPFRNPGGALFVGTEQGPNVRIRVEDFGDNSATITFGTGIAEETSRGGIAVKATEDVPAYPQLLLTSPEFDNQNIASILLQGERQGGGEDGFPRVNFGDFFGDTPNNQGQFIVNAEFRCLFEGNVQAALALLVDGAIEHRSDLLAGGVTVLVQASGTLNAGPTAATSFTQAVSFPFTFPSAPKVFVNLNSGAGATAQWNQRAISISTTGFTLFGFTAGAAGTFSAQYQWLATM